VTLNRKNIFFEIEISRLLRLKKVLTRTNILLRTVTFKYLYELKFREIGTGVFLCRSFEDFFSSREPKSSSATVMIAARGTHTART